MSKYFKTREGSIEDAVVQSVNTPKEEPKVEKREYKPSTYLGHREGSLADAVVKAVNEGLSAAQKKLPPALQKAILKKDKMKKEELDKDDEGAVKKVKDMLKKASQAHASQAKVLDKAMDEKLVGGQKKLDKDKDGDLDAKDFAMLRKSKKEDVSDMNKKKHAAYKDPKRGEHDVVDPKPKLKIEDTIKSIWQNAGDELEEVKKNAQYMKTAPAKTDVSTETEPEEDKEKVKKLKIKLDKEKDTDALEKQNIVLQGQVNVLKNKLENEKNKAVKPEPNPDTGEVPLTVGVAYKHLRDKMKKEDKQPDIVDDKDSKIKKEKSNGKAMTGTPKTPVDTEPKVDYKH
tara:strand:- start:203 stop:1234 length:1032 start_codon:yes stop_codon:yes gene_type:complete